MREDDLLSHIYARSAGMAARFPWVEAGPGDDCAVIRPGAPQVLLKTDQLIEGRHFVRGTPVDLIARKALCRPLSDLAAGAGTPLAALAAVALPDTWQGERASALFDAMHAVSESFACPLVGGDIARTPQGPLVITVSVVGSPHPVRGPVGRREAAPGDGVYLTGALGGSFGPDGLGRHLTFEPRLPEAAALASALEGRLHAMMDVSDGLGIDAGRLAIASGVRIELAAAEIPRHAGVESIERALRDGEDYELLFAASGEVPREVLGTPVTRIGSVVSGRGTVLILGDATAIDVSRQGWDHGSR